MIGAVFQMAAEFFEELKRQWSSNDHRTKGYILGRAFAEIFLAVGTGGTVAAAGHASKAARLAKLSKPEVLTRLGKLNVAKLPAPKAAMKKVAEVRDELAKLHAGKWCFLAGAMVATASGSVPIEHLAPRDIVLSRDERTFEEGAQPVVRIFRGRTTEFHALSIDADGDGQADETLKVTGEHPFHVPGEGFVPARELRS